MACDWWDLPGAAPQFATRRDPGRETWGPEVGRIMRQLGFKPMPWQQYVLDVAYEHVNGVLAYRQAVEVVPRQAGKTAKVLGAQVHRATRLAKRHGRPQRSLYTSQRHKDARLKLLEEHVPLLDASPFGAHIAVLRSTGQEGVSWSNGSQHHVAAPNWLAGVGQTLDLVQIDEAFSLQSDDVEQAVKPTQITRRNAQIHILSSAGDHRSSYLRDKVESGRELVRAGVDVGACYFEWSADGLDLDLDDPASWAAVHPAVGFTIDASALAADHASMKPGEFGQAYLAVWPSKHRARVVAQEGWDRCADQTSACVDPVCFAVDVDPDRSWAAISVAGRRADGALHVEVVDHREGTGWVVDKAVELLKRHRKSSLSLDGSAAASSLLPELERRRVPTRVLNAGDGARAMGLMLDKIDQDILRHRDQLSLNVALAGAGRRRVGDKWAWARGDADITPLISVTLAAWSLETAPEPMKFKMGLAL